MEGVVGEAGGVNGQRGQKKVESGTGDNDCDHDRPDGGNLQQGYQRAGVGVKLFCKQTSWKKKRTKATISFILSA